VELRHLRYFVTVAEELHFGRAARRLNMTQPPLSMQIRDLERELGCALLRRSSRKVELTEAGAAFLEEARGALAHVDQAVEAARSIQRGAEGRLTVGFVGMAMDAFLHDVIQAFGKEHPRVSLTLSEMSTNAQLEALRTGRLHVGFPRLYQHDLRGLGSEVVLREPYMLAVPSRHPLASRKRIPLRALEGVNLVMSPRPIQPRIYDAITDSCRRAGFEPLMTPEAVSKRTSMALVAAGMGVTVVTTSASHIRYAGVTYRPLDADWPTVEIAAVWRAGEERPARELFLEVVRHRPR
jgi:DNA-binding transcriptional LysR family regulator